MNKRIVILLSSAIIILTCCKTKNYIHISDNLIERIAKEDQKLPSQFSNLNFFAKCQNNRIAFVDVYYLRELYRISNHKIDYETFLRDLLNQNLKIDCKDVSNKFELDSNTNNRFRKIGIDNFINSYCTKSGDNRYHLNKNIPENQIKTVLYLLFINNYMSAQDDYLGIYIISKM